MPAKHGPGSLPLHDVQGTGKPKTPNAYLGKSSGVFRGVVTREALGADMHLALDATLWPTEIPEISQTETTQTHFLATYPRRTNADSRQQTSKYQKPMPNRRPTSLPQAPGRPLAEMNRGLDVIQDRGPMTRPLLKQKKYPGRVSSKSERINFISSTGMLVRFTGGSAGVLRPRFVEAFH